jgi:hypothetical protein
LTEPSTIRLIEKIAGKIPLETSVIQMTKDEFKSVLKDTIHEALTERHMTTKREHLDQHPVAALLNLAEATLCEMTSEKTIPHYKHGKSSLRNRNWGKLRGLRP